MGLEGAVGDPDPHHEVADGLALAVLASDRADAVALRVDPPPAEVRSEPLGRHRVPAFAREAEDVFVGLPRILLTLEPLYSLRLGLFHDFAHCRLRVYPRYRSGTSTHDLHRGHFAVTRPVGASTFGIALWITTLSCSLTTTLRGRPGTGSHVLAGFTHGEPKYPFSIEIVKMMLRPPREEGIAGAGRVDERLAIVDRGCQELVACWPAWYLSPRRGRLQRRRTIHREQRLRPAVPAS